jgi:hypothetical protein
MSATIGTVFRWRRDALGIAAGTVGVCYARSTSLVALLFDNGVPTTLNDYEINRYAECLGRSLELAGYRFRNLNQLLNDYGQGVFNDAFGGHLLERALAR